jgi:hypothetical protein
LKQLPPFISLDQSGDHSWFCVIRRLLISETPKEQEERADGSRCRRDQAEDFACGHAFPFAFSPSWTKPSSISGPFNWLVLQSPIDHFFAQGCRMLFNRISGREFVFRAAVGDDLVSNVVIKAQNAFVVQIPDSHELSPIRTIYL